MAPLSIPSRHQDVLLNNCELSSGSEHSTFSVHSRGTSRKQSLRRSRDCSPLPAVVGRRVSFALSESVVPVDPREDYSEDERVAVWYSKTELHDIKVDAKALLKTNAEGNSSSDSDHEADCTRGLENRIPERARQRMANKTKGLRVVLDEQDRQIDTFSNDPEKIAKAYSGISEKCLASAFRQGRIDARAARY